MMAARRRMREETVNLKAEYLKRFEGVGALLR